jgi:hypothetical protein
MVLRDDRLPARACAITDLTGCKFANHLRYEGVEEQYPAAAEKEESKVATFSERVFEYD